MPAWGCESMIAPFVTRGIDVSFYDVELCTDEKSSVESGKSVVKYKTNTDCIDETAILYVTNYFGYENTLTPDVIRQFKAKGAIIIYDRTHSLMVEDDLYKALADYSFASIRKWMGMIGGAVVEGVRAYLLKPCPYLDCKKHAMQMKQSYMAGDNTIDKQSFLKLYGEFGHHLSEDYHNYEMDNLSYALYKSEDFVAMCNKRRENAKFLHLHLKNVVRFIGELTDSAVPLFVPVFFENKEHRDAVRRKLIEEQIYCPIHWPKPVQVPAGFRANEIYDTELSLVCDQRYTIEDMVRLSNVIKKCCFNI